MPSEQSSSASTVMGWLGEGLSGLSGYMQSKMGPAYTQLGPAAARVGSMFGVMGAMVNAAGAVWKVTEAGGSNRDIMGAFPRVMSHPAFFAGDLRVIRAGNQAIDANVKIV